MDETREGFLGGFHVFFRYVKVPPHSGRMEA